MFRYIPNLSSVMTAPVENPWDHAFTRPVLPTKEAYRVWCNNPETQHAFISGFTAQIPEARPNNENNPVVSMGALIVDYDADPGPDPLVGIAANCPAGLRPCYYCRTFSGNVRMIWRFTEAIGIINKEFAQSFLKIAKDRLRLDFITGGFDEPAYLDPYRFFEIGDEWIPVPDSGPIPMPRLSAWRGEVSQKFSWKSQGVVIPINILKAEGLKRFPNGWPAGWENFDLGVRGPRFWDADASDPTAAIVRESGMQYFSDGGGFRTWSSIFGHDFVQAWQDNKVGTAIQNIWNPDGAYYKKLPDGSWKSLAKEDLRMHLKAEFQLNSVAKAGEMSEVDMALFKIQQLNSVGGVVPLLYRPDGPVTYNGTRYLNNSLLRVLEPVSATVAWGEGFPWIAQYLGTVFEPVDHPVGQLDYFLAWLKHFYCHARELDPRRGLGVFLAGPAGAGKTALGKGIIAQLMGKSCDASKFIVSGDQYNDQLFESPFWTIDDAVAGGDEKDRSRYSQTIKQILANDQIVFRAMYSSGRSAEWVGRTWVTMNDDPESLSMLPQADIAVFDKSLVLKVQIPSVPALFPSNAEIMVELPYFAAWLRDWVPPEYVQYDQGRFGVRSYTHPKLHEMARSISHATTFTEVIEDWRKEYFRSGGPGEALQAWVGHPSKLQRDIEAFDELWPNMANFRTANQIGVYLHKLVRLGTPWITSEGPRTFTILRPDNA